MSSHFNKIFCPPRCDILYSSVIDYICKFIMFIYSYAISFILHCVIYICDLSSFVLMCLIFYIHVYAGYTVAYNGHHIF